jgi:DNA-binding response OmpR family regulator/DNA-binding CsgD family transcriptional regulator
MTTPSPHAGKHILIVDDVPDNLSVLFEFLTARGFQVFVADSGIMAIEELPQIAPDLILLDVMMPGLDGFSTCERIKADERFADVPLFFLTALTDTVDKVKGFALGAVDYITKPLDPDEVIARINAHLSLRALRLELEERNEELDREMQRRIAAERALGHTLEDSVLVIDRRGEILFLTQAAQQLFARHGGVPPAAQLRVWFAGSAPAATGTLAIRRLPDPHSADRALLVFEEKAPTASPDKLAVLGLTPRETEILFWIAQGKTSPEIAVILDTAPATVKRHVHNLLTKLGVETRLAAALRAMEVLGLARD